MRSDAATLCRLATERGALSIVDAVTSLGGIEVKVDDWGVDANRSHKVQSWFLDMQLVMGYWGGSSKRAYHHTAPVNDLYALHEALVMLQEEGLEAAHRRHQHNHEALVAGLGAMGLAMAVAPEYRLPQLNSVLIPEGVDDGLVRSALLREFDLEIGAGLGALAGKTWRIGLMGYASNERNVITCLNALEAVLARQGAPITTGAALDAAQVVFRG